MINNPAANSPGIYIPAKQQRAIDEKLSLHIVAGGNTLQRFIVLIALRAVADTTQSFNLFNFQNSILVHRSIT